MKLFKLATCLLLQLLLIPCIFAQSYFMFDGTSKFKILQFTDIHYKAEMPESEIALKNMIEAIEVEKPNLVVLTGDVTTGKDVKLCWDQVCKPLIDRQIPWAVVFGNHDDEQGMSRKEIMDYITKKPYCAAKAGPKDGLGVGNYSIRINATKKENAKNATILYFMDSNAYSTMKGLGGYGWFNTAQIDWFKKENKKWKKAIQDTIPSLAFFHIPLPEYTYLDTTKVIGNRKEKECSPRINSGMFLAMKETGDIMGTFVGHDHDNDYIGNHLGIYLAYGRYSGGNTVYNNLGLNGCRVIELTEGTRQFNTYIRLYGGEKIFPVSYPHTLLLKTKK